MEVPAAAAWLKIAGPRIYDYVLNGRFHGPSLGSLRIGVRQMYGEEALIWHGAFGLSLERWVFWKMRLREIGRMDCLFEDTKTCANETQKMMKIIEDREKEDSS